MKPFRHILTLLVFLSTSAISLNLVAQEIAGPEDVLDSLTNALESVSTNSLQGFHLYTKAAQSLSERGNYSLADSLYQKGMPLAGYESDSMIIMDVLASRAFMYKVQGQFSKSLEDYLSILNYYTQKRDINQLVLVHAHLAEFYRALGDQELTTQYVYEGLKLLENHGLNLRHKAYLYSRAAAFQSQFLSDPDSTIYYSTLALQTAIEANDKFCIALSQNELGFMYMNINKQDTVKNFGLFRSAMNNFFALKRYRDYISVMENLARNYYVLDMPEEAIATLNTAVTIAEANNWITFLDDAYLLMAEAYRGLDNFDRHNYYMMKAYFTKIETLKNEHEIEASELTATYEKDIAEQRLQEQQIETQLAQEQANNNRRALIIAAIVSVVLLTIAIISVQLYFRFKRKNAQLSSQQEIIRQTNDQLGDALNQKSVLYRELNHRVKNNLTVLSGLIYLQETNESDTSQKELYQTLRQRIQSMAMVHQNLYEYKEAMNINFQEYLRQLIPNISGAFSNGVAVDCEIKCDGLLVGIDEAVPLAMIINELMTNSYKYAFGDRAKGKIKLWSETKNENRVIHYRDNGPGMPEDIEHTNLQSLGMRLVKLMAQQLKGRLTYDGNETGVYFKIEMG